MSKAYEMISESLNEIIEDFEKNNGKNLKREILSAEKDTPKKFYDKKIKNNTDYIEVVTNL